MKPTIKVRTIIQNALSSACSLSVSTENFPLIKQLNFKLLTIILRAVLSDCSLPPSVSPSVLRYRYLSGNTNNM